MPLEHFNDYDFDFDVSEEGIRDALKIVNAATEMMKDQTLTTEEYEDYLYEARVHMEVINTIRDRIDKLAFDAAYEHQPQDPLNLNYDPEKAFAEQGPYNPEVSFAAQEELGGDEDIGGAPIAA